MGQLLAKLIVDQLGQQRGRLRLLQDLEPRIQPRLDGVRAQERSAKRMNRADPSRLQLAQKGQPAIGLRLGVARAASRDRRGGRGRAFRGPRDR